MNTYTGTFDGPIEVSSAPGNLIGIQFKNELGHELLAIQFPAHVAVGLAYALADKAGRGFTRAYYLRHNTQPFLLRLKYALLLLLGVPVLFEPRTADGSKP